LRQHINELLNYFLADVDACLVDVTDQI